MNRTAGANPPVTNLENVDHRDQAARDELKDFVRGVDMLVTLVVLQQDDRLIGAELSGPCHKATQC